MNRKSEAGPAKKQGRKSTVFIILGGILILTAVAAVFYFLGRQSVESNESPTPSPFLSDIINAPEEMEVTENPEPDTQSSATSSGGIGTPTPTATPIVKQKVLTSSANLDGFRSSNGGGNSSLDIRAGRNTNLVTRGFVSFNLSDIPDGADIQEAILRLYQADIRGNPYSAGGSLKIDHLTYGNTLDDPDYASAALLSGFATLTTNKVIEWKDVEVTDQVKNDIANARSRSQFRIHFTTEAKGGDVEGDFAHFESADNSESTGNIPQLVVKYY